MSDANLNESYNSFLQNSLFLSPNTDEKKLNEAKLIEMFFVKTSMLISNSKSLYFLRNHEEDMEKQSNPDKNIIENITTFHTKYLENEQHISLWRDIDVEKLYESYRKKDTKYPPPLVIETYLDLINLEPNQNLYIIKKDSNEDSQSSLPNITGSAIDSDTLARSVLVCKGGKKNEIVLERWLLELDFEDSTPDALHFNTFENEERQDISFKEFVDSKFLIFLRYLVSLLRMLPAQELHEKAYSEEESGKFPAVRVSTRILDGSKPILSKGRIGLSKPLGTNSHNHLEQKSVLPLETDLGLLRVNVSYRQNVNFFVLNQQEVSQILSSKQVNGPQSNIINTQGLSPNINHHSSIDSGHSVLSSDPIRSNGSKKSLNNYNRGSIQFQSNFKVGSVGSVISNSLTRNPSNSSVIATLRAHRSSNSSSNNVLPQASQNYTSSESLISQHNVDLGVHQSIGSLHSENKHASQHENILKRQTNAAGSNYNSVLNERKFSRGSIKNDNKSNDDIDEFLNLISEDSTRCKDDKNCIKREENPEDSQSITESIYKFKEMKIEDSNNTDSRIERTIKSNRYADALANYRNMSSSSMVNSRKNSTPKETVIEDVESGFNQYGFSPTEGFDAENLKAVLDKSRRASVESSKRMMLSTSRNSIYSQIEHDPIDLNDSKRKDIGSVSSVSSPKDIIAMRNVDKTGRRRSSASSSFSAPRFSISLNNGNRYSGSPGSNIAHSLSSNIASRKASLDNVSLAVADTSAVYADFEKPKGSLGNKNISPTRTAQSNEINEPKIEINNEEPAKIGDQNDGKKTQHSSYNDEDDLLFFMGDSN